MAARTAKRAVTAPLAQGQHDPRSRTSWRLAERGGSDAKDAAQIRQPRAAYRHHAQGGGFAEEALPCILQPLEPGDVAGIDQEASMHPQETQIRKPRLGVRYRPRRKTTLRCHGRGSCNVLRPATPRQHWNRENRSCPRVHRALTYSHSAGLAEALFSSSGRATGAGGSHWRRDKRFGAFCWKKT